LHIRPSPLRLASLVRLFASASDFLPALAAPTDCFLDFAQALETAIDSRATSNTLLQNY